MSTRAASAPRSSILAKPAVDEPPQALSQCDHAQTDPYHLYVLYVFSCILPKVRKPAITHFACRMTVPSETVGAAAPVLLAFFPIQSLCHPYALLDASLVLED